MKHKNILLVIGALFFVALAAAVVLMQKKEEPIAIPGDNTFVSASGKYISYSPENVQKTKGKKVLLFHAGWCVTCQEMESQIQAFGVPKGMTIFKVDFDSNEELKKRYGVSIQNTFIQINSNGQETSRYVVSGEPSFQTAIDALL